MSLDPIITPRQLAALPSVTLFDCRPDTAAYLAGHLAGARHAQLERDLSSPVSDPAQGGRHPLPPVAELCARLGSWGVVPGTHVVAYDDANGSNAAARLWWLLTALGHPRVQVVDGGLPALVAAGFGSSTVIPRVTAVAPYPAHAYLRPTVTIDDVELARNDARQRVIDVRAAFRYRGEREPIDPIAGHIPGAINVPLSENLRADGSFKSREELRAMYGDVLGGAAPAQTIVHCGSGVTACHTLLALERAGMSGARLYTGSWSEWCRNPERARSDGAQD